MQEKALFGPSGDGSPGPVEEKEREKAGFGLGARRLRLAKARLCTGFNFKLNPEPDERDKRCEDEDKGVSGYDASTAQEIGKEFVALFPRTNYSDTSFLRAEATECSTL